MDKTKNIFKEYLLIILTVVMLIVGVSALIIIERRNIEIQETALGFVNSGGGSNAGVANFGSIMSVTTDATYSAYTMYSGQVFLERIVIGRNITGGGILLQNAIADNADAVFISEFFEPSVGSIDVGAYFNLGIMVTVSPGINAIFIYTPME